MSYSILGVGGVVKDYTAGLDGWLWTVPLIRNNGTVDSLKCFGVGEVLTGPVGRQQLLEGPKYFPMVPKEVFETVSDKSVQILVGNPDLSLQPQCPYGFGKCSDCAVNRCCYRS